MTNEQITIDYKNLCENYSKEVGCYNTFDGSCIKEQCFTYKLLQQLQAQEQECEELKKQLETSEEWRIKAEGLNEKLELKNTRYREALEEIEQELKEDIYCESQECGCDDFEECLRCTKNKILDIINKAKEEK